MATSTRNNNTAVNDHSSTDPLCSVLLHISSRALSDLKSVQRRLSLQVE